MRLIHTFEDQTLALLFSNFLQKEGINNQCEMITNTDWGSPDYGAVKSNIWIIDEDDVESALRWLEKLQENPSDPIFHETDQSGHTTIGNLSHPQGGEATQRGKKEPISPFGESKNLGKVTLYLLISCIVIFIYGSFTTPQLTPPIPPVPEIPLLAPNLYKWLFYDYPEAFAIIDKLVNAYGLDKLHNLADLPTEGRILLEKYAQTPFWDGMYNKVVHYFIYPAKPITWNAPLFEKIREGEIWRLFTPCLLHATIYHIFFNLIWLAVLGKLIEEKIGSIRYLAFILIVGVVSNTLQYLVSGPSFEGISGVICGMFGFIWARQHVSPWEGYNLLPGVISFMLFFILMLLAVQIAAFFLYVIWRFEFFLPIANTAHIAGGLIGYFLGRLSIFAIKSS